MGPATAPTGLDAATIGALEPHDRLDVLRRQMASIPGRSTERAPELFTADEPNRGGAAAGHDPDVTTADVHDQKQSPRQPPRSQIHPTVPPLAALLPHRGITRGTVLSVHGATSVLLSIIATVTAAGGHTAIIGMPKLGLLAAHEMGADLTKCALVPEPGHQPADIAAILLDGVDLVVLGLRGAIVAPTRARGIAARTRSKAAVLIVIDGSWPGVDMSIDTAVAGYLGMDQPGRGRITGLRLDTTVSGRGFRPRTGELRLTSDRGVSAWSGSGHHAASALLPTAL